MKIKNPEDSNVIDIDQLEQDKALLKTIANKNSNNETKAQKYKKAFGELGRKHLKSFLDANLLPSQTDFELILEAIEDENFHSFKSLLNDFTNKGKDITSITSGDINFNLLHLAALKAKQSSFVTRLLNLHMDIESTDELGNTPLFYAIEGGGNEIINYLISLVANTKVINIKGQSLLMMAARREYHNAALMNNLNIQGNEINAKDYEGNTPLH